MHIFLWLLWQQYLYSWNTSKLFPNQWVLKETHSEKESVRQETVKLLFLLAKHTLASWLLGPRCTWHTITRLVLLESHRCYCLLDRRPPPALVEDFCCVEVASSVACLLGVPSTLPMPDPCWEVDPWVGRSRFGSDWPLAALSAFTQRPFLHTRLVLFTVTSPQAMPSGSNWIRKGHSLQMYQHLPRYEAAHGGKGATLSHVLGCSGCSWAGLGDWSSTEPAKAKEIKLPI